MADDAVEQAKKSAHGLAPPPVTKVSGALTKVSGALTKVSGAVTKVSGAVTNIPDTWTNQPNLLDSLIEKLGVLVQVGDEVAKV